MTNKMKNLSMLLNFNPIRITVILSLVLSQLPKKKIKRFPNLAEETT